MKAIIRELWDTGINIITTAADSNEIQSLSDLRKCENVLVGKKEKGAPSSFGTEIMIDDDIVNVSFRTVSHPSGFGRLIICEIQ